MPIPGDQKINKQYCSPSPGGGGGSSDTPTPPPMLNVGTTGIENLLRNEIESGNWQSVETTLKSNTTYETQLFDSKYTFKILLYALEKGQYEIAEKLIDKFSTEGMQQELSGIEHRHIFSNINENTDIEIIMAIAAKIITCGKSLSGEDIDKLENYMLKPSSHTNEQYVTVREYIQQNNKQFTEDIKALQALQNTSAADYLSDNEHPRREEKHTDPHHIPSHSPKAPPTLQELMKATQNGKTEAIAAMDNISKIIDTKESKQKSTTLFDAIRRAAPNLTSLIPGRNYQNSTSPPAYNSDSDDDDSFDYDSADEDETLNKEIPKQDDFTNKDEDSPDPAHNSIEGMELQTSSAPSDSDGEEEPLTRTPPSPETPPKGEKQPHNGRPTFPPITPPEVTATSTPTANTFEAAAKSDTSLETAFKILVKACSQTKDNSTYKGNNYKEAGHKKYELHNLANSNPNDVIDNLIANAASDFKLNPITISGGSVEQQKIAIESAIERGFTNITIKPAKGYEGDTDYMKSFNIANKLKDFKGHKDILEKINQIKDTEPEAEQIKGILKEATGNFLDNNLRTSLSSERPGMH